MTQWAFDKMKGKKMFIEGATYGYKNNEMSNGFNRSRFICLDGIFYRLDATGKYIVGTAEIEESNRLVLIEE